MINYCRFPKCENSVILDLLTKILDSRWKEISELREKIQLKVFIQSVYLSSITEIHDEASSELKKELKSLRQGE